MLLVHKIYINLGGIDSSYKEQTDKDIPSENNESQLPAVESSDEEMERLFNISAEDQQGTSTISTDQNTTD